MFAYCGNNPISRADVTGQAWIAAAVGGGIAGLEAARVAAIRGHNVDVYEKEDKIGGQIHIASVPPRKDEILRAVEYYKKVLPRYENVKIHLNTEATKEIMNNADAVIVAVGAHNMMLPIPGSDNENVVSSWDILNKSKVVNGRVVVIGGGLVGAETGEYLANQGAEVSIVEMTDKIAREESSTVLPTMMKDFADHNVKQYVNTRVLAIENNGTLVKAFDTKEEKEIAIECDYIVMAAGSKKNVLDVEGIKIDEYYYNELFYGTFQY